MDAWERMIRERIEQLKASDPEQAARLEAALDRCNAAFAELEEQSKRDAWDESRMRGWGVLR
jgi:hypothetical protein